MVDLYNTIPFMTTAPLGRTKLGNCITCRWRSIGRGTKISERVKNCKGTKYMESLRKKKKKKSSNRSSVVVVAIVQDASCGSCARCCTNTEQSNYLCHRKLKMLHIAIGSKFQAPWTQVESRASLQTSKTNAHIWLRDSLNLKYSND